MIPVEEIKPGQCFRKKNGEFAYLRISDSSARFYGLPETHVYGVCFNGNVTKVERGKLVVPVPVSVMAENRAGREAWDRIFARKPDYSKPVDVVVFLQHTAKVCGYSEPGMLLRVIWALRWAKVFDDPDRTLQDGGVFFDGSSSSVADILDQLGLIKHIPDQCLMITSEGRILLDTLWTKFAVEIQKAEDAAGAKADRKMRERLLSFLDCTNQPLRP
jgi:hypothetical protein